MSPAVRGAGGIPTQASSAVRVRGLRRSEGSSGQPLSAAALARAAAAFAVAGHSFRQHGERGPSAVISSPVSGGRGSGSRDA